MPPTVLSTVPHRRRAVDCRYGMCQAGTRRYFRPGYGRLQSAFEEQEQGQRGRDTTMVIRRSCGIVVTVYLALIIVVPSRLT